MTYLFKSGKRMKRGKGVRLKIDGLAQQFRTTESERPNSFSGVAGDAAVGEEVRRVGEDEADGVVGDFFEEFEAVTVIEADVVFGVVENGSGEIRRERAGNGFGESMINGDR
jgi:hypothetical protein